jgi:aldehyde dehydrogenase (NAD+)
LSQTHSTDRTQILPQGMFVDNALVACSGAAQFAHVNPATGRVQRTITFASAKDVESALASSAQAFERWKRTTPLERRELLQAIARALRADAEELAAINALEVGTPLGFGRWAVSDAAAWFDYYAGWTDKITGETIPVPQSDGFNFTVREPVGVVVKILTWNTPIGGISMAVPAALAAGCTVILKPAEQAPFAAVRFAKLCADAGLPPGVVNVVVGDATAGDILVRDRRVAKVSFTGGPATARKLQAAAAENLTPLVLELGGKSANIIFADADLTAAAQFSTVITALSGQGCSLPSRLLVQKPVYEQVIAMVVKHLAAIPIGDPFADGMAMGPVINDAACERILKLVSAAVESGAAKCAHGGKRLGGPLAGGFFVAPTLLRDVAPDSAAAQDEIFGPVVSVIPFDDEAEALRIANGTRYGLAAYVHTTNLDRALRMCRELRSGGVGVNGKMLPASYATPFGGVGLSGYGREGGREGIDEFLHVKNLAIRFNAVGVGA